MPLIVSHYLDHNERYGPEKRGGVQQKFAKISQSVLIVSHRSQAGHQWTQLLLQVLGEASGQLSWISTGKHVASSWWSVQTPACHDVRDSASVGCVQWCDDSSKSPGELNNPLLSVVIRGLPLFGISFTSGTTSPSLLTTMWKFRLTPRTRVQNCTIWLTVSNN